MDGDDLLNWTDPVALNTNATSDLGDDDVPQITTDGTGSWVTVWTSTDMLGGTIDPDHDILVARLLGSPQDVTPAADLT
jgi:hypothetical protein